MKSILETEKIAKFQQGGAMPAGGGQDPLAQLIAVAQQAIEGGDCEAAMAVAQGLIDLASGGAPAGTPAQANGGTLKPVFKAGGKLSRLSK